MGGMGGGGRSQAGVYTPSRVVHPAPSHWWWLTAPAAPALRGLSLGPAPWSGECLRCWEE